MDGAFDMPACVVLASHINNSEILSWYLALGLHHSGELLFVCFYRYQRAHPSQQGCRWRRTCGDMNVYGALNDMNGGGAGGGGGGGGRV